MENLQISLVRTFDDVFGNGEISSPTGLVFIPSANAFLTVPNNSSTTTAITSTEEEVDANLSIDLPASIQAVNITFDPQFNRLLGLNPSGNQLIEVQADSNGNLSQSNQNEIDVKSLGIQNARGISAAPDGTLYVLDGAAKEILRIEPNADGSFEEATVSRIEIPSEINNPRGIAFNSTTGTLHISSFPQQELFEVDQQGEIVAVRDLSPLGIRQPESLVFAPSGDLTDDPNQLSLYVADSAPNSGGIVELSLDEPVEASRIQSFALTTNPPLVQTIDTSQFSPSSPDPAGITYLNFDNTLLISDSEVNENPFFGTENGFESSLTGSLIDTFDFRDFSREPTGITYNPANQHLFISNDDADEIVELDPGADLLYDTADDIITILDTRAFGSFDPEGVTFASGLGSLFVADGLNSEVYQIATDGTLISNFDTSSLGVNDPEGIEYDPSSGNLYIVGNPVNTVVEVTTSGTLVNTLDISAANPVKPAGLALGQNSQNSANLSIYITDRGIDNNADPNENDGKVYEFDLGAAPSATNQSPMVNAGNDQTITDFSVLLDATANDDGLPAPPAALTYTWSQVSGPGTATFSDPNAEDTTVNFPNGVFGEYVFSLEASDSELSSSDEVTVTVVEPPEFSTIYISPANNGSVNGIAFEDEDILAFDTVSQTWSLYFEGSDVSLDSSTGGPDNYAFDIDSDGSILLSLNKTATLPDVGSVDENDIIRFVPTSLGDNTAGTYEWYLDGSDVELTGTSEDIDSIAFNTDGRLVIGTKGSFNATGVSGKDEDLFVFNATSFGESTSGTFELYVDGSNVGLADNGGEDINAAWIDSNGDIYLSTDGAFDVPGATGDSSDIFSFTPDTLGSDTSGTFSSFWDGSENGFGGQNIDGLALI